jgi:competence protein ComEC
MVKLPTGTGAPVRGLAAWRRGARPALAAVLLLAAAALGACGSVTTGADAPAPPSGSPGAAATAEPSATPSATPSPSPSTAKPKPSPSAATTSRAAVTRVVFVDVGQGDAIVVTSGSWAGLIDGGPSGSAGRIKAVLRRLGVRRLDTVVVSHFHSDHTGGLPEVVAAYRPRRALVAGKASGGLAAAFRGAGTKVLQVRRGDSQRWGAARVTVLSPPRPLSGDANGDSVVLLLNAQGRRLLFTGDLTGPNEAAVGRICARGPPADVLKVSHHGSRYSTTSSFLSGARPRTAVISVGRNSYGHPTQDAVGRLRGSGARVYSTRKNGDVTVTVRAGGRWSWSFTRTKEPLKRGVSRTSGGASTGAGSGSSSGSGGAAATGGQAGTAPASTAVYVTRTGEKYHVKSCGYLAQSRIRLTLKEAKARGHEPCSVCRPPR